MSCSTSRERHREENLRNSTIARLLLDGKLQESIDSRPPAMDLSIKKLPNKERRASFGVRELLSHSQSSPTNNPRNDSKLCETALVRPLTSEERSSFCCERDVYVPVKSRKVNKSAVPDSVTDAVAKFPVSSILLVEQSRAQRCSEALRSLLMRPSSLLQIKNSPDVLQDTTRSESLDLTTKCGFAELAKYLYVGDKLFSQTCNNSKLAPLDCCSGDPVNDEEKLSYVVKKEGECSFVFEEQHSQMESKTRSGGSLEECHKRDSLLDRKQWSVATKCKRKLKPDCRESSSGSKSTPEIHVSSISDQKVLNGSLKLSCVRLPVALDVDHAGFEGFKKESKVDEDRDKSECDYDTFRKFKRFRKCLPAHPPPTSDAPRGCQCNLKNLIDEINSSKKPPTSESGTQCLRNSCDASTQCDIPAPSAACSKKFECESENGVTEGISMTNEVVLKCFHCGITFEDDVIYSIHMGCHCHRDPFICNLCGRQCDNKYVFNTHILRGHQSN